MTAPDVGLATAIVADLNDVARSWDLSFTAERTYTPTAIGEVDLGDEIVCLVNPWAEVEVESLGRDTTRSTYPIDIGFMKRLEDKTITEIDGLRDLVTDVISRYIVLDITVAGVGKFVPLRRLDLYITFDPDRLDRTVLDGSTKYTGDFLSIFRIPYVLVD